MKRKSLLLIVMMFALTSLSTINAQEKKSLIGDYLSISGWMNIQLLHPENAPSPIVVTLFGIVTLIKP